MVRMIESMRVLERAVRPSVTCVHAYMHSNGEYECLSEVSERASGQYMWWCYIGDVLCHHGRYLSGAGSAVLLLSGMAFSKAHGGHALLVDRGSSYT